MGIDEYTDWVKKVGSEPMLAVNLGTGTPEEASQEIEYTNMEGGTYYSELRKKHGYEKPHNIKMWCLGNEMDGSWQMGQKQPRNMAGLHMRLQNKCVLWIQI